MRSLVTGSCCEGNGQRNGLAMWVGNPVAMWVGNPVAAWIGNPVAMWVGNPVAEWIGNPVAMWVGNPGFLTIICFGTRKPPAIVSFTFLLGFPVK